MKQGFLVNIVLCRKFAWIEHLPAEDMVVSPKNKKDMIFKMRAISPWACYPHKKTQNVGDSLSLFQEVRIDPQSTSK